VRCKSRRDHRFGIAEEQPLSHRVGFEKHRPFDSLKPVLDRERDPKPTRDVDCQSTEYSISFGRSESFTSWVWFAPINRLTAFSNPAPYERLVAHDNNAQIGHCADDLLKKRRGTRNQIQRSFVDAVRKWCDSEARRGRLRQDSSAVREGMGHDRQIGSHRMRMTSAAGSSGSELQERVFSNLHSARLVDPPRRQRQQSAEHEGERLVSTQSVLVDGHARMLGYATCASPPHSGIRICNNGAVQDNDLSWMNLKFPRRSGRKINLRPDVVRADRADDGAGVRVCRRRKD
jgi:hypothetical protein